MKIRNIAVLVLISLGANFSLAEEANLSPGILPLKSCEDRCASSPVATSPVATSPEVTHGESSEAKNSTLPTSVQEHCASVDLFKVEKTWSEVGVGLAATIVTFCTISCATGAWEIAHPPKTASSLTPFAGPGSENMFKGAAEAGDKNALGIGSLCILSGIIGDLAGLAAIGDITSHGEKWSSQLAQAGLGVTISQAGVDAAFLAGMVAKRGKLPLKWDAMWSCTAAALGVSALALSKKGIEQADLDMKEACEKIEIHSEPGTGPASEPLPKEEKSWLRLFEIQEAYCREPSIFSRISQLKAGLPESSAAMAERIITKQVPIPGEIGPLGKLVGHMPNSARIPQELEKRGLTVEKLTAMAIASKSTKEFMALTGAMPMMPTDMFDIIDQGVKSGELKWDGSGNAVFDSISVPGKDHSSTSPSFSGLNTPTLNSMGEILKTQEARENFQTVVNRYDTVPSIYHPHWTGNIFEIISSKIGGLTERLH